MLYCIFDTHTSKNRTYETIWKFSAANCKLALQRNTFYLCHNIFPARLGTQACWSHIIADAFNVNRPVDSQ